MSNKQHAALEVAAVAQGAAERGPERRLSQQESPPPAPAPATAPPVTQASVILSPKEIYEHLVGAGVYRYHANLPRLFILGIQSGWVGGRAGGRSPSGQALRLRARLWPPPLPPSTRASRQPQTWARAMILSSG